MLWLPSCTDSRRDSSRTFFARGVNGGDPDSRPSSSSDHLVDEISDAWRAMHPGQ